MHLSLLQLNENSGIQTRQVDNEADLKTLLSNPKLSCGCSFLKELPGENCNPKLEETKPHTSLIQKNLKEENNGIFVYY